MCCVLCAAILSNSRIFTEDKRLKLHIDTHERTKIKLWQSLLLENLKICGSKARI
jgi:hypothetical protein